MFHHKRYNEGEQISLQLTNASVFTSVTVMRNAHKRKIKCERRPAGRRVRREPRVACRGRRVRTRRGPPPATRRHRTVTRRSALLRPCASLPALLRSWRGGEPRRANVRSGSRLAAGESDR